jgi:hypothetical protein
MPISLHTAVIGAYLQILPQVSGFIDKAEEHCKAQGRDVERLTGASLSDDMWNFAKQVSQVCHHSARAIVGVRSGTFGPETQPVPVDVASIRKELDDTLALVKSVDASELDSIGERDMAFEMGTFKMNFTVEDFLLSFSLPNFYFHATTAYDILRGNGVALGKPDYLGRIRLKQ